MGTGQQSDQGLEAELIAVHQLMAKVAEQLDAPLRPLVHARIARAAPLLRAGVVLATAVTGQQDNGQQGDGHKGDGHKGDGHEGDQLRQHRIHLAAALEMLRVAHNIHTLLLVTGSDDMEASVMGSTILAGDYCFSNAAVLAASTDNPQVVTIFAQALKTVSENNLKGLFGESEPENEDKVLFEAGARAARVLAQLPPGQVETLAQTIDAFSRQPQDEGLVQISSTPPSGSVPLNESQQRRWRQLFALAA